MDHLLNLITRYPELSGIRAGIEASYSILKQSYKTGGKMLVAGNGGSAADAEHIVGELMKRFHLSRPLPGAFVSSLRAIKKDAPETTDLCAFLEEKLQTALPAISLVNHSALASACINDVDASIIYAQQVIGWGKPGDVFTGISTSGNAKNVICAAITAKALGMSVIALTGGTGGELAKISDAAIIAPEKETYKIQELHIPIYHTLCLMLEEEFFS